MKRDERERVDPARPDAGCCHEQLEDEHRHEEQVLVERRQERIQVPAATLRQQLPLVNVQRQPPLGVEQDRGGDEHEEAEDGPG
jgi:hypothetical protein